MLMNPPVMLPLFFNGRHYDLKWRHLISDLPFWARQAGKYADPVLELGCGTGRVALHLAQGGWRVTGIDISDSMLYEAKRKSTQQRLPVEWMKDDIRTFELRRKFPLVIFPFNTLAILSELADLEACLASVKKHLAPGGRFIIDVFNPSLDVLRRDPAKRYPHREYPAPDGGGVIVVTESNVYDAAHQINRLKLFYKFPGKEEEVVEELSLRIYFPQELDALLKYNGFAIENKFGNYDESPFESSSQKQLIICSAQR